MAPLNADKHKERLTLMKIGKKLINQYRLNAGTLELKEPYVLLKRGSQCLVKMSTKTEVAVASISLKTQNYLPGHSVVHTWKAAERVLKQNSKKTTKKNSEKAKFKSGSASRVGKKSFMTKFR